MDRYEYKRAAIIDSYMLEGELNTLGNDGWELVSASVRPSDKGGIWWYCILKRQKRGQS